MAQDRGYGLTPLAYCRVAVKYILGLLKVE